MRLALLPSRAILAAVITKTLLSLSTTPGSGSPVFRIAVPADLHFGELSTTFGPLQDAASALFLKEMLQVEQPDLVILNGDLITGEDTLATDPTRSLHVLFEPMIEAGVPWASTYGNHDQKYNLSREALFDAEAAYPQSLTQHGPPGTDGVTNYYVPLHSGANHEPAVILWFLDSRGGSDRADNRDDVPNWVSSSTVSWFLETSAALESQYGKNLQHLVFVHIPPLPFYEAQKEYFSDHGPAAHVFPGLNDEYPLAIQSVSGLNHNTYGGQDQPLVDALLLRKVHSIWSGHDHGVSWCSTYPKTDKYGTGTQQYDDDDDDEDDDEDEDDDDANKNDKTRHEHRQTRGPFLCFCKHSGSGGYGPWQRGIRMLDISFPQQGKMQVDTWVRMDDMAKVSQVSLNETYGKDWYPAFDVAAHGSEFLAGLRKLQLDLAR